MTSSQEKTQLIEAHNGSMMGGALLIAGTCIGAGMLAMPTVTGPAGLVPALFINLVVCLYMLATGLLYLEATLWMPDGAHFLSMAERFLGRYGKWLTAVVFLFLYYCLEVAYVSGGAPILSSMVQYSVGIQLGEISAALFFVFVVGLVVVWGTKAVDRINWLLMAGFFISFLVLNVIGFSEVEQIIFQSNSWILALLALPVLFGAYGFHNLIPTLATYLNRDMKKLRLAIIIGALIPLVTYSIWQIMVLEILGEEGIQIAIAEGVPVTEALSTVTNSLSLKKVAVFFGFFALVTSLLGVSLSMVDFIADGLHEMNRSGVRRLGLVALVLTPPFVFAIVSPGLFNVAMGLAGGFGEAFLNGLFPVALVWIGRYQMNLSSQWHLPGGKPILVLLFLGALLVAGLELLHLLHFL